MWTGTTVPMTAAFFHADFTEQNQMVRFLKNFAINLYIG
jgi:hypothetical protein